MKREDLINDYVDLIIKIQASYNKIKVIDNYDFYVSNSYTIFYLNKNESFDKFNDLWKEIRENCREKDMCYDDILWEFNEKANKKFDYMEIGTLDIYTDSQYKMEF